MGNGYGAAMGDDEDGFITALDPATGTLERSIPTITIIYERVPPKMISFLEYVMISPMNNPFLWSVRPRGTILGLSKWIVR